MGHGGCRVCRHGPSPDGCYDAPNAKVKSVPVAVIGPPRTQAGTSHGGNQKHPKLRRRKPQNLQFRGGTGPEDRWHGAGNVGSMSTTQPLRRQVTFTISRETETCDDHRHHRYHRTPVTLPAESKRRFRNSGGQQDFVT